ncbi:ABC transporter ATP-binding protein [Chroogloeocystis siderophila]|uniref:ABC transporter ATP-binding protein n=1 Tax=Chroogloeocystis siderophila TaxID=329163 RepID=UPI001F38264F|nr:ABC transporter ATP-binding protein [Chroogloeocystis siderophila]
MKEILLPHQSSADEFWALRDINLEVPKGQTLGIVGRNGSGKSTLLQILAGTLQPTTGQVSVNGRISALLELGSGFNPEFTGRQNVFFNGRLLGLSHQEIAAKFDEIAGFADIGDFIDQPVKTYSSGMFVRLAFAVAVNVYPEVLIVDEALAVGDVVFQHRCMRRMRALMDSGVTTLFVSHDSGAVKTLCNSAVMLHEGRIYTTGSPNAVIIEYMKLVTQEELGLLNDAEQPTLVERHDAFDTSDRLKGELPEFTRSIGDRKGNNSKKPHRRGNRKALIQDVKILNSLGEYSRDNLVFNFNEEVTLVVDLVVYEPLQGCIVGFFVCDKNGNEIIGSNTWEENLQIGKLSPGEKFTVQFKFKLPLRPVSYSVTVAGSEDYTSVTFDWIDNALVFQVLPPDTGKNIHALVDLPMSVEVSRISNVSAVQVQA